MKVKDIFTSPDRWLKGAWATKPNIQYIEGELVSSNDANATCFCLVGAIRHCYRRGDIWTEYSNVVKMVMTELKVESETAVINWNDDKGRVFNDVKDLVNKLDI